MIYLVSVKYNKTLENGTQKNVTEVFAVEALSPTECEAKISEEFSHLSDGFSITSIKTSRIGEIVDADKEAPFYNVKASFITLDERTAAEKRTTALYLVRADTFDEAKKKFDAFMQGTISDWEYDEISRSRVVDLIP